jgi:misacylated tRNA(Ala) deacylase
MELLFREDAYEKSCSAKVVAAGPEGIRLDRTVFYPTGGGQPGDHGRIITAEGRAIAIIDTRKGESGDDVVHVPEADAELPAVGSSVTAEINWERRHRLMRMHSCMHLLCAVVSGDVTGGQVGAEKSRLDFNLPDTKLDKEAITSELNRLIVEDHPVKSRWISESDLAAQPELVRTMSVKPPSGSGQVRVLEIVDVDLQPCGGTHVRSTAEIGPVRVGKIENKGRQNRRINIHFDD